MRTLALTDALFDELVSWLNLEVETAGVLLVRSGDSGNVLLAGSLHPVSDSAYFERAPYRLSIGSQGYVPALRVAADRGEIACFIHSHPRGSPDPSDLDDDVDEELRHLFPSRTGQPFYVSLVVGGTRDAPELAGRIFHPSGEVEQIARVRVAGQRIRLLLRTAGEPLPAFDRQVRAFGSHGQEVLRHLRIGIAGAGGTGSAVAEHLIRLGVGELIVIDDDAVSETNLTRIHQSTFSDVGTPKVEVAARLSRQLEPGTIVHAVVGRVTEEPVARFLASCDVIFGCTDDHAGRAVLSRLAYWYLIPTFDMGVVIDSSGGTLTGVFARVTTIGPGAACLICRDIVDPIRMRDELLDPDERAARVAEGYAAELGEPDPSVIAYTTFIASLAVSEFLSRLFCIGDPVDDLRPRLHDRKIGARAGTPRSGHYCSDSAHWGRGDQDPFLDQTW